MKRITFGNVKRSDYYREFEIIIDSVVVGCATLTDDYPDCVYCTSGLELEDGRYLPFEYEFSRNAKDSQRSIREYLKKALLTQSPGEAT